MPVRIDLVSSSEARQLCDQRLSELLGSDQTGSLSVALSADGQLPATHFGASGVFADGLAEAILTEELWVAFDDTSLDPASAFDAFVDSLGLQRISSDD